MSLEQSNNGKPREISVRELTVSWNGKDYRINQENVIKAFDRAKYGDFTGPHARYFLEIEGELKTVESVFALIVPVPVEEIGGEKAARMASFFEALGFEVLDRDEHHGR
jgi:hypothetical protein